MFKNYFTLLVLIVAVNSLFAQMYVSDNYKGVAAIIGGETILEDHVRIEVYNTLGQSMGVLLDDSMPAGEHEVTFNAQVLPSGVYFYGIKTRQFSDVKKMILLK